MIPALLFAVGCSPNVECTLIGSPVGVGVQTGKPEAESAVVEVCWDGSCKRADAELHVSRRPGEQTCSGDTCSVTAAPTGEKNGFANVTGLPKRPVEIRLTLRDARQAPVLERTIKATPKGTFPNGPGCGEQGPQVQLTVAADGTVRER
ncbi:hypothetical protein SAMN05444920_102472 [Nonomuraea solani]|uniref:Uncharacterized protein n=1 Tax=Nonomuraea solani TaxID=1144553 RepID=A0A1H5Z0Q2_9ACTN|nr:hypothetical protein [Nonomuraea solani]SEG29175.1 hypothetical protein SAMN05444920_102472 [Nonomuraea solani]